MFERFTESARQVVVLAQDEARERKHNYIGTEHILMALLKSENTVGQSVLNTLGVTVEAAGAHIDNIVGVGVESHSGQIPFTPRGRKVLELALREALSLGHNYIGTEHILLGLVREAEGVALQVLLNLGATPEKVRDEVIRAVSKPSGPTLMSDPDDPKVSVVKSLNSLSKALTQLRGEPSKEDELLDNVNALVVECVKFMKNLNSKE